MKSNVEYRFLKTFFLFLISLLLIPYFMGLLNTESLYAANVLSNPSFTGGTTGWTLSTTVYDSSIFQDSAGSVKTETAVGRNSTAIGTADQQISATIEGGSTVYLNFYWSKQCVAVNCGYNTIEIRDVTTPATPITIWSDTSVPAYGARTSWAAVSNVDVSSYFTTTGTYTLEVYATLRNGNNASAQSLAWVDNINLDVIPPNITTSTTGTQATSAEIGKSDKYIGGAFTFVRDVGSATVSSITVSELGTISDTNISGLILYYKQEATCSTTIPGDATQFNSTAGSFSSGSSTVTGSMSVGTSQVCVYVEVDIGSGASVDDTVMIQITNPSTQVTASSGTVSPSSTVAISGTTTIVAAVSISITSDGVVSFGNQDLNTTTDTTSSDLNDIETVSVDSGPVDLDFRSSIFTDGGNDWTYASTNGDNEVKFEFSKDGTGWTTVLLANTLYSLDTNVAQSATRDIYLRLTTPTSTTSYSQYSTTITVVASVP